MFDAALNFVGFFLDGADSMPARTSDEIVCDVGDSMYGRIIMVQTKQKSPHRSYEQ